MLTPEVAMMCDVILASSSASFGQVGTTTYLTIRTLLGGGCEVFMLGNIILDRRTALFGQAGCRATLQRLAVCAVSFPAKFELSFRQSGQLNLHVQCAAQKLLGIVLGVGGGTAPTSAMFELPFGLLQTSGICVYSVQPNACDNWSVIAAQKLNACLVCFKTPAWASLLLCAAEQLHVHVLCEAWNLTKGKSCVGEPNN